MAEALRVVDTSAWIEWLLGSDLGRRLRQEFPERDKCIVPTMVQLELAKWLVREVGEDEADRVIAYTEKCQVAALDTRIALLAADLHRQHRLATADAVVYATARQSGAELLTCDAHFKGLPGVVYFSKSPKG
ncbi:type II toxin-antitoxin system VapC family toxin [Pseudomonas sp. BN417]|uniref:type II toxin-antitoxin system VapC family toxin n=1 Tax=Pseudomonas sp. BN417 TaxID=2567890 RepID=UPI0024542BB7|nr:type II toxin-antitoxin system VapC family toxin [Pseudomonas sp. BN417]MDH4554300.1 type II toxin-antitoxin system VapC family toxin [Pseudomonas sp. BN417]